MALGSELGNHDQVSQAVAAVVVVVAVTVAAATTGMVGDSKFAARVTEGGYGVDLAA